MARSQCLIWPSGIAGLVSLNRYCKRKLHHCRDSREIRAHAFFPGEFDLIPITGAYRHRTPLFAIAGYEGVGIASKRPPLIRRCWAKRSPLMGQEPGSAMSTARWRMRFPSRTTSTRYLPRAYINPLAAQMMLDRYPPVGKNGAAHRCRF